MPTPPKKWSGGKWALHLAVPITALVCLFGFWRLAPGLTFIVALAAFVALVVALWIAGKDKG